MYYSWFKNSLNGICEKLKIFRLKFVVNEEEATFDFDEISIKGNVGKTVWYIPALDKQSSLTLGVSEGQALKIVKLPVFNDLRDEYFRLVEEMSIQKQLCYAGLAKEIYDVVLVENENENIIEWLQEEYVHPKGSIYLATVVEHVYDEGLESLGVKTDLNGNVFGTAINNFLDDCRRLRIEPYDITCRNLFNEQGRIIGIDFHKWKKNDGIVEIVRPDYVLLEINASLHDNVYERVISEAMEFGVTEVGLIVQSVDDKSRLLTEGMLEKAKGIIPNIRIYTENIFEESDRPVYDTCVCSLKGMVIMSNGNCVPCYTSNGINQIMGNVINHTLEEIWNSNNYKWFRYLQRKSRDLIDGCKDCRFHNKTEDL